ncbi:hypothetical protein CFOL_v3_14451 [Cephalotus follicularis]|uniref:Uncharacterized protein n=1 Tax=Cephalotus follicularis TaxID=3775 RepID=A0A1Q3BSP6_CEPFO|nr:hypothetical protein CFOL_v3_14451 [Cephalotus follicularis]
MSVLDSPLEALALDYVSFGFLTMVNNLWTWVAVITAAVSLWRIRAAAADATTFSVKVDPHAACLDRSSNGSHPCPEASSPEPAPSASAPAPGTSPSKCDVSDDRVTKGKFIMYYEGEREDKGEGEGQLRVVKEWGYNGGEGCGEWWESWERVMSIRMEYLGWYRCQDLTAINGSVVRLWDECRIGRYNSGCAVSFG